MMIQIHMDIVLNWCKTTNSLGDMKKKKHTNLRQSYGNTFSVTQKMKNTGITTYPSINRWAHIDYMQNKLAAISAPM